MKRRRISRRAARLGIVMLSFGAVFVILQAISMESLDDFISFQSKLFHVGFMRAAAAIGIDQREKIKSVILDNLDTEQEEVVKKYINLTEAEELRIRLQARLRSTFRQLELGQAQLGVHPAKRKLYDKRRSSKFWCSETNESIPFSWVNDDYCDCDSAVQSDEPSTSACGNARFFCAFQLELSVDSLSAKSIPSSRVDDGIVDCCDASDEYSSVYSQDKQRRAIQDNRSSQSKRNYSALCERLINEHVSRFEAAQIGQRVRAQLANEVRRAENPNGLYGQDGVYRLLAERCFSLLVAGVAYEICPFRRATQLNTRVPSKRVLIGSIASWMADGRHLRMMNGDSELCPSSRQRETVIEFACGLTDKLVRVSEPSMCLYEAVIETPAAC